MHGLHWLVAGALLLVTAANVHAFVDSYGCYVQQRKEQQKQMSITDSVGAYCLQQARCNKIWNERLAIHSPQSSSPSALS